MKRVFLGDFLLQGIVMLILLFSPVIGTTIDGWMLRLGIIWLGIFAYLSGYITGKMKSLEDFKQWFSEVNDPS